MSTTGGTWMPHTPDWITPPAWEVADAHLLSYGMIRTTRRPWVVGVAAAISWVRGGRVGPVTERTEQPVTRDIAGAERWAAEAARDPGNPPPMDVIYTQLRVAPMPSVHGLDANYCVGSWRALRWILGVPGQDPPLRIPRRHPDGHVYVAADLYAEATRGDDSHLAIERRREIQLAADFWAAQYLHTAAQIRDIQRNLTAGS
ncbi:MAG: hypothetical protein ACRDS0_21835 [Pseudonocardiaceae bacterium]